MNQLGVPGMPSKYNTPDALQLGAERAWEQTQLSSGPNPLPRALCRIVGDALCTPQPAGALQEVLSLQFSGEPFAVGGSWAVSVAIWPPDNSGC